MPLTKVVTHGVQIGSTIDYRYNFLWRGWFSVAHLDEDIVAFIKSYLENQPKKVSLLITQADGIDPVPNDANRKRRAVYHPNIYETYASICEDPLLMIALCTRSTYNPRFILSPLDDISFRNGVYENVINAVKPVPWEHRHAKVYWRGRPSGELGDSLRTRVVERLLGHPHADAKLNWYEDHIKTGRLADPRCEGYDTGVRPFQEFAHFKYNLIVDGALIASSLEWTFASGCVPILITHPGNDWWFKRYLEAMKHYVPVAYDLSDLEERIEWLVTHDDEARAIAENAVAFSKYYLSSDFQKYHLTNELNAALAQI